MLQIELYKVLLLNRKNQRNNSINCSKLNHTDEEIW
jgi:hypothetical protein